MNSFSQFSLKIEAAKIYNSSKNGHIGGAKKLNFIHFNMYYLKVDSKMFLNRFKNTLNLDFFTSSRYNLPLVTILIPPIPLFPSSSFYFLKFLECFVHVLRSPWPTCFMFSNKRGAKLCFTKYVVLCLYLVQSFLIMYLTLNSNFSNISCQFLGQNEHQKF